jgi:hypothetical protein
MNNVPTVFSQTHINSAVVLTVSIRLAPFFRANGKSTCTGFLHWSSYPDTICTPLGHLAVRAEARGGLGM